MRAVVVQGPSSPSGLWSSSWMLRMPRACSAAAAAMPDMPAPMMATSTTPGTVASQLGGGCSSRGAVVRHFLRQGGETDRHVHYVQLERFGGRCKPDRGGKEGQGFALDPPKAGGLWKP